MSQVKKHSAYQRYRLLSKDDLELPNLLLNENGNGELFIGEVYCRVQGCTNGHQFQTTNHLRKHIAKMHTQMTLETSGQRGGRPTKPEEAKAIAFYIQIIADYDIRHADDHTKLLDLPLRKDGKGVLVTMMKKMVKDEGLPIPCEQCILDGKQKVLLIPFASVAQSQLLAAVLETEDIEIPRVVQR
ncbi:uncharacterized protein N7473_003953 [Penicillium subrubescens]|uniref:uncharacterized protein n=1 Tax=Penicillium subrubescens TaxID=1316194 RepID=UPI0025459619|nr:uncharacterized protein N7473_003953 [Penicillium subrubescens]KAJ5907037.1 hypothetical protein N7473_003953 [Penicillium subrubescens]